MRRGAFVSSAGLEILVWGFAVESTVRPEVVVEVLEGVDVLGDLVDVVGQVDDGVELVAPGAVASLDGAVELGRSRRQHVERNAFGGAGELEFGHELGATIDLDGLDGPRHFGGDLVEDVKRRPKFCMPIPSRGSRLRFERWRCD